MSQKMRAETFTALHRKGDPVILYNIWDAGSAQTVIKAGAKAIATGSASVAGALGYQDGEDVPLDAVLANLRRVVAIAQDIPVTLDFEGGYASAPGDVAANVAKVVEAGAVGINFEDQIVGGKGLYDINDQCKRIAAVRQAADGASVPFYINARTDIFLKADRARHSTAHVAEALERAKAYAAAGASGLFVPGVVAPDLIAAITGGTDLPVNVMMMPGAPDLAELRKLNVGRVSYGPFPFRDTMKALRGMAEAVFVS